MERSSGTDRTDTFFCKPGRKSGWEARRRRGFVKESARSRCAPGSSENSWQIRRVLADERSVEYYLTREPVLDRGWNIAGYEVLMRTSDANNSRVHSSVASQLLANEVLGESSDHLFGGKPALMDFDLICNVRNWTSLLSPDQVVIEIANTVTPDNSVLPGCRNLQEQGYPVMLETSGDDSRTEAFAPFIDILKVDFEKATAEDQASLISRYRNLNLRMLARNIRTVSQFQDASRLGYDFFQGPFFASSAVQRTSKIPASSLSSMRLLKLVQQEEMDLDAIEDAIRHDVALSHSLLKYLNSAAFVWVSPIESVRRALLMLGAEQTRRWVSLASLRALVQNRPPVLVAQVLARGRFCEALINKSRMHTGASDPFMAGIFSLLDAIMERPLGEILDELKIGNKIRDVLLGAADADDPLFLALKIVKSYEVSDFETVRAAGERLVLSSDEVRRCYLDSLRWVDLFESDQGAWPPTRQSDRRGFHRNRKVLR